MRKVMGWFTALCKMLLFHVKTIMRDSGCIELPRMKEKKVKHYGCLANF